MPFGGLQCGRRAWGRCGFFLAPGGGEWSISDSIMVLQSFRGEPVPPEQCQALQAELAARAGKQLGGDNRSGLMMSPLR